MIAETAVRMGSDDSLVSNPFVPASPAPADAKALAAVVCPASDRGRKARTLADDPELKVLRHDLLGLCGFVPRSEDEQRRVVPHALILIVGDEELIPARRIPTLTEDRHQRGIQATNHLIYISKESLVLADPALPLLEHTGVITDFEIGETVIA